MANKALQELNEAQNAGGTSKKTYNLSALESTAKSYLDSMQDESDSKPEVDQTPPVVSNDSIEK